jgi:uncharacterized phiE125 gp8 family phage protein
MPLKYSLKRTTAPTVEPVTVQDIKDHLRLSGSDDDVRLASLITAARMAVETDAQRALINQTWTLTLDDWPRQYIELPYPPLSSVTSIKYVDTGGTQQTWSTANYEVDTYAEPGLVRLAYQADWPSFRGEPRDIEIIYVAGYGATAADVPERFKQAVRLRVEMDYDCPTKELVDCYQRVVNQGYSGVYPA